MEESLYVKKYSQGSETIDDGWSIYKRNEDDGLLDLIAVVDTETLADTFICALCSNQQQGPIALTCINEPAMLVIKAELIRHLQAIQSKFNIKFAFGRGSYDPLTAHFQINVKIANEMR